MELVGVTSGDQAWKDGRYHIATARLRPETYSFGTDIEHIVCTRGDLIRVLSGLMKRKGGFDAIVVETTGLADPGPVAQTFFVDDDVRAKTELDSVITVG